jgi:large subunit ribosomal protein L21
MKPSPDQLSKSGKQRKLTIPDRTQKAETMFAVLKTGGKQYRVAANDVITIEKLEIEAGQPVSFDNVLLLTSDAGTQVGAPYLSGVSVSGEVVEQTRGKKVIAFKKRRRQNSKRKRGHRQDLTIVRITEILMGGAKPSARPAKTETKKTEAKAVPLVSSGKIDSSNLSLISGIGPTIEKKLRAAGITSWETIAAWSEDDLAKWDKDLALRGRAKREEWIEQANELLAGKPPRAKADQDELASGKDL